MPKFDYDLFVIGAGSGGVRAARLASRFGARVAVCEDRRMGGTCVNAGCVPKKLLVYGSSYGEAATDAAGYGWHVGPRRFDWQLMRDHKDTEISRLNDVYTGILRGAGVDIIHGRGVLQDPHTVAVGGERYTAERILVVTGSRPFRAPIPGAEHGITSDEIFHLKRFPKRLVIAGGGYIAVEFATIFRGFGAEVSLVHRSERVLSGFDEDVRHHLGGELAKRGVELYLSQTIERIDRDHDGYTATLKDGTELRSDELLVATGRVPNTRGLGLEDAGVTLTSNGAIPVDDDYRTSVPSIYALGDVIDRFQLTPVALAEATAFAKSVYGGTPTTVSYEAIPTAVFTQPPVGTVGLTEAEARERYAKVTIFRTSFTPMKHTLTGRGERTLMKLIVDAATDRVVGCHMVGEDAGEIVQGLAIAMQCGATKAQFDATIGIHPTAAEEFVTMREPVDEAAE